MSLNHLGLDAFEAIAELGTIVLASERLGVTQTALTQRIKALEAELEVPLFTRSRKGMMLTHEGKILYEYASDRRRGESQVLKRLKGMAVSEVHRLRISGPTLQTERRFLEKLPLLRKSFPELYFTFEIDDSEDLLMKLKEDKADLVLTSSAPHPSLRFKKLNPSELVLVGPSKWKERTLKDIVENESIIDFNSHDTFTIDFLKKHKLFPRFLPERNYINNTHQMISMVEAGLGYAVFDSQYVEGKIRGRKLINLAPEIRHKTAWFLCWNDSGEKISPFFKELIDFIN